MIALKDYQVRVLESVRDFFRGCSRDGTPSRAFEEVQERNGTSPTPYVRVPASGLEPAMPYVCLRVPTGGGKTLLACYAAGLAMDELLHAERSVILWLVPSNAILDQTADALRDPRHDYRRALDLAFGAVEVVTIEEALRLSRATVDGRTVVIVSTIQSFRAEDPSGRKVYEQNGSFSEHMINVPVDRLADLQAGPDGQPKPSLVNMLRLRRPIVVVDEAHNARTELSFATLASVSPSCILEFTATPARTGTPSNVLHRVSAAELKAADMVKLPLRVITRHPSQREQLLADALTLRTDLERLAIAEAQQTAEYIRPILLVQADRVDACAPLRDHLVSEFGLRPDEVKISVGSLDELKNVKDIAAPTCPIRVIITVQRLREGWDCPFAYVLCSLRETRSPTAIEQLVGRILRLPNAKQKRNPDLNCAYAFSVSASITEVLAELREALESNGFTAAEAERIIIPVQGVLPLGAQPRTITLAPAEIDAENASLQVAELAGRVAINATTGEITVLVPLDHHETAKLTSCVRTQAGKQRVEEIVRLVVEAERAFGGSGAPRTPTPYEQRLDFLVPLLSVREGENLFEFESTVLLEHPWKLSDKDATLSVEYNPLNRPDMVGGVLDVGERGEVQSQIVRAEPADFVATLHAEALALAGDRDWSVESLVAWLDRHIDHRDIPVGESAAFLRKVLRGLTAKYGAIDVGLLALDRFRLRNETEKRIQAHRDAERTAAFQTWLLPESALVVSPERALNFMTATYEPSWLYEGGYQFKKHYFGPRPGELTERTAAGKTTEEFKCAQFLDELSEVAYWVRNLVRKRDSFRLQTPSGWFYPDFVCKLNDGRALVVEYKGTHLFADAGEKRLVGAVWAARSDGRCLFVMPTAEDFSSVRRLVSNS